MNNVTNNIKKLGDLNVNDILFIKRPNARIDYARVVGFNAWDQPYWELEYLRSGERWNRYVRLPSSAKTAEKYKGFIGKEYVTFAADESVLKQ